MLSIKDVYKIGAGPSSSHTMGPELACKRILELHNNIKNVEITLYGSLSLTGKGHLTDAIIKETLIDFPTSIKFNYDAVDLEHENTMKFIVELDTDEKYTYTVFSIGGGDIFIKELDGKDVKEDVYPHNKFREIQIYCEEQNISLSEYVFKFEPEIKSFLEEVWNVMKNAVEEGLSATEDLPGKLKVKRRAKLLNQDKDVEMLISSFAYAVSEQNASGGQIVTAPTCGACGVIPAILYYLHTVEKYTEEKIIEGLAVAGIIGAIIKKNASISGAVAGCQAEVGSATAMAAAAYTYIVGGNIHQIESAAEIGLEHQLGLTCDPVLGYVQIPCIQRNAVGAIKARVAGKLGLLVSEHESVKFDTIVQVMYETGKDLQSGYRETSTAGLAKYFEKK